MNHQEKNVQTILRENNGYITSAQVTNAGIPRRCLSEMLLSGAICKVGRGIYCSPDAWEDEMFFLQYRYRKGVYSHGTALYLHGLTDRTPQNYTMTFPYGYNPSSAKIQGIIAKVTAAELYEIGTTEIASPCDNSLRVYDVERALCDIVRGINADNVQLINPAMKLYVQSDRKDIAKLIDYSEKLRVKAKILNYIQVLL